MSSSRSETANRHFHRPTWAALFVTTLLAACSDDLQPVVNLPPLRIPIARLPMEDRPPDTRVVHTFDMLSSDHAGFVRKSDTAVLVIPDGYLFVRNGPPASIHRKVHFQADKISGLRVLTRTAGDARLRLEWVALDAGKVVRGKMEFRIDGDDIDRITEVDLRGSSEWKGTIEAIGLQTRARRSPVVLQRIEFTHTLPDPQQLAKQAVGDGMVLLGDHGRRAQPLVVGKGGVQFQGVLHPGERVSFEVGLLSLLKPNLEKPNPEKSNPEKPNPEKSNPEKPNPEKPNPEKPNPEKHSIKAPSGDADIQGTEESRVPLRLTLHRGEQHEEIPLRSEDGWSRYHWRVPVGDPATDGKQRWIARLDGPDHAYAYITDAWREIEDHPSVEENTQKSPPPNVILITADTLRRNILSFYGDDVTLTPHLDSLAGRGVVFDDVTTAANVTLPSHVSILSSLYPKDHGCIDNITGVINDVVLLPEVFAKHGYATGAVIGSVVLSAGPTNLAQGFDEFHQLTTRAARDADAVTDDAIAFIERHREHPFFLWVHYYDPHMPYDAPAEDLARYYTDDPKDPRHGPPIGKVSRSDQFIDITDWKYPVAQYRAEITSMDREIGRLFSALNDTGESADDRPDGRTGKAIDNTLIAFTADHGESLTENDIYFNHVGLFPSTVRVPWVLAGPGIPSGLRVREPQETVDIAPTLLRSIGVDPLLTQRGVAWSADSVPLRERPQYFQHSHGYEVGMRTARFHAMLHLRDHPRGPFHSRSAGDVELFRYDPSTGVTTSNVTEQNPDDAKAFQQQILRWLADTVGFEGLDADLTEERERALRELGYLGG